MWVGLDMGIAPTPQHHASVLVISPSSGVAQRAAATQLLIEVPWTTKN